MLLHYECTYYVTECSVSTYGSSCVYVCTPVVSVYITYGETASIRLHVARTERNARCCIDK